MKKFLMTLAAVICLAFAMPATAQVTITKVAKIAPTDMVFMDMAVEAAKTNVKAGKTPSGAVIILNGAFRSSGRASEDCSAEVNAYTKSRLSSLKNAKVYTVNEPITETYVFLSKLGVDEIFFVNGREEVIKAGLAKAEDYNDAAVPADVTLSPLKNLEFPDATNLLK